MSDIRTGETRTNSNSTGTRPAPVIEEVIEDATGSSVPEAARAAAIGAAERQVRYVKAIRWTDVAGNWDVEFAADRCMAEADREVAAAVAEERATTGRRIDDQLSRYLAIRGVPMPSNITGAKTVEEANELREAIASGQTAAILDEIADVALSAAVVARHYGVTVEDLIERKTRRDCGRGPKVAADAH